MSDGAPSRLVLFASSTLEDGGFAGAADTDAPADIVCVMIDAIILYSLSRAIKLRATLRG